MIQIMSTFNSLVKPLLIKSKKKYIHKIITELVLIVDREQSSELQQGSAPRLTGKPMSVSCLMRRFMIQASSCFPWLFPWES